MAVGRVKTVLHFTNRRNLTPPTHLHRLFSGFFINPATIREDTTTAVVQPMEAPTRNTIKITTSTSTLSAPMRAVYGD